MPWPRALASALPARSMPSMSGPAPCDPPTWSPATIGFYVGCALVGIGTTVAAFVIIMFPGESFVVPVAALGVVLLLVGSLTAWRYLRKARQETGG